MTLRVCVRGLAVDNSKARLTSTASPMMRAARRTTLWGEVLPPSARWSAVARVLVEASPPLRQSRPEIEMHLHRMPAKSQTASVWIFHTFLAVCLGMFDPVLRCLETHLHTQASFQSKHCIWPCTDFDQQIKIGEHTV